MVKEKDNIENNENKNNIDYKKQIDDLNKQVMILTNNFTYFKKNLEKILSESIDKKFKEKEDREQETQKLVDIYVKNSNNQPMFNSETGERIRDNKSDFRKAVDTIQKSIIKQNELPFFKNNQQMIKESLIDNVRKFLIDNPIKNFDEFIERIKAIDPHVNEQTLESIKCHDDIDYYNKLLLDTYDNIKALEQYKIAKAINENDNYKYGIPYIQQDFSLFNMTNNLKEILKDRGISMEKLSELIGVSRNTMTSIINNKGVSAINMFKTSMVLQLPIEQIFRYEPMIETVSRLGFESNFEDEDNE